MTIEPVFLNMKVYRFTRECMLRTLRCPTPADIAEGLNITPEEARQGLIAIQNSKLPAPVYVPPRAKADKPVDDDNPEALDELMGFATAPRGRFEHFQE